jgi:hypothetical protein
MPGVDYFRIQTGATEGPPLHGGLTDRAIPDLNGRLLFVNAASLDETVGRIPSLGGSEWKNMQDRFSTTLRFNSSAEEVDWT